MIDIIKVAKELHKINFNKDDGIIHPLIDDLNPEYYDFNKFKELNKCENCCEHNFDENPSYCIICNKYKTGLLYNGKNNLTDEENDNDSYHFTVISHGAHSTDFFCSHGLPLNAVKNWSRKPVMFVMENPASPDKDYDLMDEKYDRYPRKTWYWLNDKYEVNNKEVDESNFIYPNYFVQKEYGWMIYSVIKTFHIANAYLTNMVKCGIGSDKNKYKTTDYYNQEIVESCINRYLLNELNALRQGDIDQTVIVFAFGQNTYYKLKEQLKDKNCKIYLLPHPANRLANDYRKYVLFGKIMRGLLQSGFYDDDDGCYVDKPDLERVIKDDKEQEDIVNVESMLKSYSFNNKDIKKRKTYKADVLGYELVYDTDNEISDIIFRYCAPMNDCLDESKNRACWANFNMTNCTMSLYIGKKKTADKFVPKGQEKYLAFRALKDFISTKLNIDPIILTEEPKK